MRTNELHILEHEDSENQNRRVIGIYSTGRRAFRRIEELVSSNGHGNVHTPERAFTRTLRDTGEAEIQVDAPDRAHCYTARTFTVNV